MTSLPLTILMWSLAIIGVCFALALTAATAITAAFFWREFAFSPSDHCLTLLRKNSPEWQKGKLNGVGGHIERDETPREAIARETREGVALNIPESDWTHFATLYGPDFSMRCFYVKTPDYNTAVEASDEGRPLVVTAPEVGRYDTVPNIPWLVNMALHEDPTLFPLVIHQRF